MEIDTLPKLLLRNYEKYGDKRTAMRKKKFGIWQTYTWKEYYEQAKYFSLGLISLGLQAGEKVTILGDNDPEWYWAELAAQAAGAVPLGIFPDSIAPEIKYILDHSESTFVVAKDQEQVDKILSIRNELPRLKKIIYWEPKGLWSYDDPILLSFTEVVELGRKFEVSNPDVFERNIEKGREKTVACLCYTSGTTGVPKGVMLTYKSLIGNVKDWLAVDAWQSNFEYVTYMSPAWAAEQAYGITSALITGMKVNFPEEPETVTEDIREIGPHAMLYSSRLWESLSSTIQARIADSSPMKRFFYQLALPIGYKMADMQLRGESPNLLWRTLRNLSYLMVFRPLLCKHGLTKLRYCYTAGSFLHRDTFRLFRAIGVTLKQLYGSSEASVATMHREEAAPGHTVGEPIPGMEVRITGEGEIIVRSESLFSGYYKEPETTSDRLKQGWFYSGDGGYIDDAGQLIYLDRLSEMLGLADGSRFSPQYIEGSLRFSPYIRDAVAIGGEDKPYVATLINIDFANVSQWTEANRIAYTTFADLSQKPQVINLIRRDIERTNRTLPESTKIKKYILLHKELDPDEAEMTRTRKLKRDMVMNRYKDMVEALYSGEGELSAEALVAYRDGRKGRISTQVKINLVE